MGKLLKNHLLGTGQLYIYSADLKKVCVLQLAIESFGKEIIEISKITLPTLKQTVEVKVQYKVKLNIFKN